MAKECKLHITGMTCAACVAHVERAAAQVKEVQGSEANLLTSSLTIYIPDEIGKKEEATEHKKKLSATERARLIEKLTGEMREAAKALEFEKAAFIRDQIKELKSAK